jgi:hypothetical protein
MDTPCLQEPDGNGENEKLSKMWEAIRAVETDLRLGVLAGRLHAKKKVPGERKIASKRLSTVSWSVQ